MNISSNTILNLTDYLLLNSYTLTSSGLYEGKAGHALCLFEMARFFRKEELDESAFDLLEEALLSKIEKIDFGFGLSGIGYSLAYLIRHDFVEADFHDFFGQQQESIFEKIQNNKEKWTLLELMPFLIEYKQLVPSNQNTDILIATILNDSIHRLEKLFTIKNWHEETRKESWISYLGLLFRNLFLLQVADISPLYHIESLKQMADNLAIQLKIGRIYLTEETAFYTTQIPGLDTIPHPDKLIMGSAVATLSDLASLIRLSTLQAYTNNLISVEKNPLEAWTDDNLEQMLNAQISKQQKLCSWQQGIIRYLLYWISRVNPEKRLFALLLH